MFKFFTIFLTHLFGLCALYASAQDGEMPNKRHCAVVSLTVPSTCKSEAFFPIENLPLDLFTAQILPRLSIPQIRLLGYVMPSLNATDVVSAICKRGFTFNMKTVKYEDLESVANFLKKYKQVTKLKIKHLKGDVLSASLFRFHLDLRNQDILKHTFNHLRTLDVENNNFSKNFLELVAVSMPNLHNLKASNRANEGLTVVFRAEHAIACTNLKNLRYLGLANMHITTEAIQGFSKDFTKQILTLDITSNPLEAEGAQIFAEKFSNLLALNISNNALGDSGAQHIAIRLPTLQLLQIAKNSIADGGARIIADHLSNLRYLDIRGNNIGKATQTYMRQALPRTHIIF